MGDDGDTTAVSPSSQIIEQLNRRAALLKKGKCGDKVPRASTEHATQKACTSGGAKRKLAETSPTPAATKKKKVVSEGNSSKQEQPKVDDVSPTRPAKKQKKIIAIETDLSKQKEQPNVDDVSPTRPAKKQKKIMKLETDLSPKEQSSVDDISPAKKKKKMKLERASSKEIGQSNTDDIADGDEQTEHCDEKISNGASVEADCDDDADKEVLAADELDSAAVTEDAGGSTVQQGAAAVLPGHQKHDEVGGFTVIGDVRKKAVPKVQRVLPNWLAKPTVISDDIRFSKAALGNVGVLDQDLIRLLRENGITHLFPVQNKVIPELLGGAASSHMTGHMSGHVTGIAGYFPNDVCCSAPTGSGKTLTFVLPLVQMLKHAVVCRVRALVVLPVHDLATQVYKVFQAYIKGTNLKVALIVGQKSFVHEQHLLVRETPHGYCSRVDIVVATPGRLVDHISQTSGFELQHLRYLVIDEADRMMDEIKHDWLNQVENAVFVETADSPVRRRRLGPLTAASAENMGVPFQKLLFSATLSQNPEKLQQLNLFQPRLFTSVVTTTTTKTTAAAAAATGKTQSEAENSTDPVGDVTTEFVGKYTTPSGLTEYFIQSTEGEKPLHILHLLHHLKFRSVLCFTNSVESTHRLFRLVNLVGGITVQEFSSNLHPTQRARILRKFAAKKIDMLICSDAMSRGMDVSGVQCVVSYEVAPRLKTYIHRVGRTARAGRVGTAISLLEKKQVFHFKKMLQEAGKSGIKELKIRRSELRPLLKDYKAALLKLPDVLKIEKKKKKKQQ